MPSMQGSKPRQHLIVAELPISLADNTLGQKEISRFDHGIEDVVCPLMFAALQFGLLIPMLVEQYPA